MSARSIARALLGERAGIARLAVVTGALVVFDAALIEPIAVRNGLWSWNERGLFTVPPIGILGWGFFAAAATFVLEHTKGWRRVAVLAIAPLATHALLLAAWWGLFRWVLRAEIHAAYAIAVVLAAGAVFLVAARRTRAALTPSAELVARGAATAFFAALLARRAEPWLVAYAIAFTPPHLLLCAHALAAIRIGRADDPGSSAAAVPTPAPCASEVVARR